LLATPGRKLERAEDVALAKARENRDLRRPELGAIGIRTTRGGSIGALGLLAVPVISTSTCSMRRLMSP